MAEVKIDVSTRIQKDINDALEHIAVDMGVSKAQLIQQLINDFVTGTKEPNTLDRLKARKKALRLALERVERSINYY